MPFLDNCLRLRNDFTLVGDTMIYGHQGRHVAITDLNKEYASLLQDHHVTYESFLTYTYLIHGAVTLFRPNEIVQGYTSLAGPLAEYARHLRLFGVVERKGRTFLYPMRSPGNDGGKLVEDSRLFFEEAQLLGKLSLSEKTVLAGHRNRSMTLQSYDGASKVFLDGLRVLRVGVQGGQRPKVKRYVDLTNECAGEMLRKVGYYPSRVGKLKQKLENSSNVASSLLASRLQEDQGDFSREISISTLCLRTAHLIRSLLYEAKIYPQMSKSAESEYHKLEQACDVSGLSCPEGVSKPERANSVLDFVENEVLKYHGF